MHKRHADKGSRSRLDGRAAKRVIMGRRRKTNKELPKRVYIHGSTYRYHPAGGKPIPLAKVGDYPGMLRALADLHRERPPMRSMRALFARYEIEILPGKAATTQADQRRQLQNLAQSFGHMEPADLRQPHAIAYRNKRAQRYPTAANREMELLSHVCTIAVEWGIMDSNPLRGMRKIRTPPRDRYVTDDEYLQVYSLASPMVQCVMDLALLTGLRRGDIFLLTRSSVTDDGLEVQPGKTKKTTGQRLLFEWTPALRAVVARALNIQPQVRLHIVCNRRGRPYGKNAFDSAWQRLMKRAVARGVEKFEFRDLRRKSASDELSEAVAQKRLGHVSSAITRRVYRVRPSKVKPLR